MPQTKSRWDQQWRVKGSAAEPYTVSVDFKGNFACSCVGWTRHVPRKDCKHITRIRAKNGFLRNYANEPEPVADTISGLKAAAKKIFLRSTRTEGL